MSEAPVPVARRLDLIAHNQSQNFRLIGEFVSDVVGLIDKTKYIVVAVSVVAAPETLGGSLLVAGAAIALDFAIGKLVDWGAGALGEAFAEPGIVGIKKGSNNVSVNRRPAARGSDEHGDPLKCHEGKKLIQGSQWVTVNKIPLSRFGDWTNDSGKVATGSGNVFCGGPKTSADTESELQKFIKYSFIVLSVGRGAYKGWGEAIEKGGDALKGAGTEAAKEIGKATSDAILDKTWDWMKKTPLPE